MNLAEIIMAYMKEQGVGATELSKKSGVPLRTVNNIINGLTEDPRLETVRAIVAALGHSLNEIDCLLTSDSEDSRPDRSPYYLNPEVAEKAQEIYEDPETRILLDAKRDLTPEDLDYLIRTLNLLKAKDNGRD